MAEAFKVLIHKTGKLFRVEGNAGALRTRLPDDIKNGSIYDILPEHGHSPVSKTLESVSSNTGPVSPILRS